ncbi:MAG TPA: SpoIID/LytB domain-containing protein [Thermoanaerobaculia bacterium]|nr:SpoIID/LytB domain-containing protein [Thermoanaerobaculia bacterium]
MKPDPRGSHGRAGASLALALVLAACSADRPRPEAAVVVVEPALPSVLAPRLTSPPLGEIVLPDLPKRATAPAADRPAEPIGVRIGLAGDLAAVTWPCCTPGLAVELASERLLIEGAFEVVPESPGKGGFHHRLQVAALRDEEAATDLARRLAAATGQSAEAHYDPSVDLYRVRVGRFASRAEAEALKKRGIPGLAAGFLVAEPALGQEDVGLLLRQGSEVRRVGGRRLVLVPPEGQALTWQGQRYRGRLVVHLNPRGSLNVVNELPLEGYLRGVVPKELGPEAYPRLEALKAQAVAARTYTLRNLGLFELEGYDLCATPRCQVYGGLDVEHPLSDRAVAETVDQVLIFDGRPIESFYTASCGGHTEDVRVVFPNKRAAYLHAVPCVEAGEVRLGGSQRPGALFPAGLAEAVEAAESRGQLQRQELIYLSRRSGGLVVLDQGIETRLALPAKVATFRRDGGRLVAGELRLAAGDRLVALRSGAQLLALLQEQEAAAFPRDRAASLRLWTRTKTEGELAARVSDRFPGFPFRGFEVLERGVSGRVGKLRLLGFGGKSEVVTGLEVRFLLDLPETLFTVERDKGGRGRHSWVFKGQGWGHGVGLCQTGAFSMAGRGASYRDILAHYYRSAQLARVRRS